MTSGGDDAGIISCSSNLFDSFFLGTDHIDRKAQISNVEFENCWPRKKRVNVEVKIYYTGKLKSHKL